MPAPRQLSFLKPIPRAHGGEIRAGKRKEKRPVDPKQALHIVLRSSRARGAWSMLRHRASVQDVIDRAAQLCHVRVYRFANVGNHLHLLVRFKRREDLKNFLRVVAGRIAALVTGAIRGRGLQRDPAAPRVFWDHLVFTRIVSWGREFRTLRNYLIQNLFEAAGLWNRKRHPEWTLVQLSEMASGAGPPDGG